MPPPFRWSVSIVLHEQQATTQAGARTSSACTCRPKPTSAQSWLLPTSALSYGTDGHDVLPARRRPNLVAEIRARIDARERCPETEAHRRGTGSRTECRSPTASSQRVTPPQIHSSTPTTASAELQKGRCHTHVRRAEDDAYSPIAQRTRLVRANSPQRPRCSQPMAATCAKAPSAAAPQVPEQSQGRSIHCRPSPPDRPAPHPDPSAQQRSQLSPR